eukprot:4676848-Amphidinium_carterae.1
MLSALCCGRGENGYCIISPNVIAAYVAFCSYPRGIDRIARKHRWKVFLWSAVITIGGKRVSCRMLFLK